mgnify:CR=1 FL=1
MYPTIEMTGLQKRFDGVEALSGVDLKVGQPALLGLIGRNGSGKTTLVSLLPRFYDPHSGSIRIDGSGG